MRRFILRQERVALEGVMFSDGFIVLHGDNFHGVHVASLEKLEEMAPGAHLEWIDE